MNCAEFSSYVIRYIASRKIGKIVIEDPKFEEFLNKVKELSDDLCRFSFDKFDVYGYSSELHKHFIVDDMIINYVAHDIDNSIHYRLEDLFSGDLYRCNISELNACYDSIGRKISIEILGAYRRHYSQKAPNSPIVTKVPEKETFSRPVIKFDENYNIVHGDEFKYWAYKDEFAKYIKNLEK